jgi:hypothetical protein
MWRGWDDEVEEEVEEEAGFLIFSLSSWLE